MREHGIEICLQCFVSFCPKNGHSKLHHEKRNKSHSLFLNIKTEVIETVNEASKDANNECENRPKLQKLAIEEEQSNSEIRQSFSLKCYECQAMIAESEFPDRFKKTAQEIANAPSAFQKAALKQHWEYSIEACTHSQNFGANHCRSTQQKLTGATNRLQCDECDADRNIWLCLACGHRGCGRRYFDGSGGNNHAADHFAAHHAASSDCLHALCVKLGTVDSAGNGDIYCYACDQSVLCPDLHAILEKLGFLLDAEASIPKEKSTLELELEMNQNFTPTGENGAHLKAMTYKKGLVGISNLGNSCYMSSIFQALFALEDLQIFAQSFSAVHLAECTATNPFECFMCQFLKLNTVLHSDWNSGLTSEGVAPKMFKLLVGKLNAAFQNNKQQDAHEFLELVLEQLKKTAEFAAFVKHNFEFVFDEKYRCIACNGVFWKKNVTSPYLIVPLQGSQTAGSLNGSQLLEALFAPSPIDFRCGGCEGKTTLKSVFIKRLPRHAIILLARYFVDASEGMIKKSATNVEGLDSLNFAPYLLTEESAQLDGDEWLLPAEMCIANNTAAGPIDAEEAAMLMSMGFSFEQAAAAIRATAGKGVEAAAEWLLSGESTIAEAAASSGAEEVAEETPESPLVNLRAFVHHRGSSAATGHYVAYVRCQEAGWVLINDESVFADCEAPIGGGYIFVY